MIQNSNTETRGQVGIGTLIIFIAMVLVAAVAAGVLINTSGMLESTASDTGQDAQAEVSNQITVVSATGEDSDGTAGIETIRFTVMKSAGSGDIDLEDATVEYQSAGASATLTQGSTADSSTFVVKDLSGATQSSGSDGVVLTSQGERKIIEISPDSIASQLSEGGEATVRFVDQSGATTIYGVNVPDTISGSTYVQV